MAAKGAFTGMDDKRNPHPSLRADSVRNRALEALLKAGLENAAFKPLPEHVRSWREHYLPAGRALTPEKRFELVLVASEDDLSVIAKYYHFYEENFLPSSTVVITKNSDRAKKALEDLPVKIVDENQVFEGLTFEAVRKLNAEKTGWYFQQFLKMAYSYICQNDFYFICDGDTVPLNPLCLYQNGKTVFIKKGEYFAPYFNMIDILFDGKVKRDVNFSFIAECMLIDKRVMAALINDIENNDKISGGTFFEKILNQILLAKLRGRDFSEYETYGNYVNTYYKNSYTIQELPTLREGMKFFNKLPEDYILYYLSRDFDMVSFEKKYIGQHLGLSEYVNMCMRRLRYTDTKYGEI